MIEMNQAQTKRLVSVHGWSGTLLGLLLYAVIVTGAVAVFDIEINKWSQGITAEAVALNSNVDHHFRKTARDVDRGFYERVTILSQPDNKVRYLFHGHFEDPQTNEHYDKDLHISVDRSTGEVVKRWEGRPGEQEADTATALRRFLVDLHIRLYVPAPWGFILTGVLGLALMAAAVTGILIHKHLIRDAFLSARGAARLVGARDLHALAGTWGLPFAFLLAFTGAFYSFALSVSLPAMVMAAFGGDMEAAEASILPPAQEIDLTPAPMASLDYILADAIKRTGAEVSSITITNYDSKAAEVRVSMGQAPTDLTSTVLGYDGTTRSFEGVKPGFGQVPSAGNTLVSLMAPLHFGNFAGFFSKIIWLALGAAMAYSTATGILLWTKRREDSATWRGFRHWSIVTFWGLPLAMLGSAVFYFLSMPAGDPMWWTPAGFMIYAVAAIFMSWNREKAQNRLRIVTGATCLGLPLLRHLTGGASWSEALIAGAGVILVIDLLLLALGTALLWRNITSRASDRKTVPPMMQEPAE